MVDFFSPHFIMEQPASAVVQILIVIIVAKENKFHFKFN